MNDFCNQQQISISYTFWQTYVNQHKYRPRLMRVNLISLTFFHWGPKEAENKVQLRAATVCFHCYASDSISQMLLPGKEDISAEWDFNVFLSMSLLQYFLYQIAVIINWATLFLLLLRIISFKQQLVNILCCCTGLLSLLFSFFTILCCLTELFFNWWNSIKGYIDLCSKKLVCSC